MHFDFEPKTWLKAPPMALVLEHIYGVQTADRRHSILYAHFSMNPEQLKSELTKTKSVGIQDTLSVDPSQNSQLNIIMPQVLGTMNYQQIANEAIQKLIKYEVKHTICSKALIYYTSRFGVIYNTVKSSQTFYQGHSVKISAITKHPISSIVATGEVASSSPNIHIWDAATLETIVILKTAHRGGVMHLTFSNDGSLLLSVGMDKTFSMQVFQWQ